MGETINRWYNRQACIKISKTNDAKTCFKKHLNDDPKCWEFARMESMWTDINQRHRLNLPIQTASW